MVDHVFLSTGRLSAGHAPGVRAGRRQAIAAPVKRQLRRNHYRAINFGPDSMEAMTLRKRRNWNDPGNWVLPDVLTNLADDRDEAEFYPAAQVLAQYFRRRPDGRVFFSGARFDRLGRSDDSSASNCFTAEDLVAVSMLSVKVPAHAALVLTGDSGNETADAISEELKKLPPSLSLEEAKLRTTVNGVEERGTHYLTMQRLWRLVTRFTVERSGGEKTGIGETRASKLLARKRPHLFPSSTTSSREPSLQAMHPSTSGTITGSPCRTNSRRTMVGSCWTCTGSANARASFSNPCSTIQIFRTSALSACSMSSSG